MEKQSLILLAEIAKITTSPFNGFDDGLYAVKNLAKSNCKALYPETNPVVELLDGFDSLQTEFVIKEYSAFSYAAIHMLLDAALRNHDWKLLQNEIIRNINEEKGEETKDIPHLEMMRQGYKNDLGIETDNYNASGITMSFLDKMKRIFKEVDNAFVAGALMAFEGSAIPEFVILDKIVTAYRHKKNLPAISKRDLTQLYIDGHKDFEIGHEQGLIDAVKPFINSKNTGNMIKGYVSVCIALSTWWEQLAVEAVYVGVATKTQLNTREDFDVTGAFLN
ncbi:MAG: DUF3865 domain-containing protein [Bacteroidetes bacterium]|nr:MAG: DUF3865 domain-containing protein [Bacteroidota bacterium]